MFLYMKMTMKKKKIIILMGKGKYGLISDLNDDGVWY